MSVAAALRLHGATRVEPYRGGAAEWDAFVSGAPGGTFFHLLGWRDVLEAAFGFRSHYLVARRAGRIVGVLPLCEIRPTYGTCCLLSLPFAVECGVCATDDAARGALERAAVSLAEERRARYLELRDGLGGDPFRTREGVYHRFRRTLLETDAENFAALPRKRRSMVRSGQKNGLVVRVSAAQLDIFYDLYARSVHRLGTPVFARRYFELLLDRFPDQCAILAVWFNQTPVAAVLSFFFDTTVLPYYAGSRREYFRYAVNDFMYWELMRYARERGARVFDFGRSKRGTGAFDFKRHWGFEPEPLRYRVYGCGNHPLPDHTTNDRTVRLLCLGWQRLPLAVTKILGPVFVRRFGPYFT